MLRHLKVFLASPADVADERGLALKVLEQLPYDSFLRGKVGFEIVAWDKPGAGTPMQATMTPQEAIAKGLPKPSECNIVFAVFWSRMGTLLPADWVKPQALRYLAGTAFEDLDSRYLSGTEWEYFDALQAAEAHGRPKVLVYRRTEEPVFRPSDPRMKHNIEQWELVNAFFNSFRNAGGSLRRGYNEYSTPADFEQKLEHDLREMIKTLLEEAETPPSAAKASPETSKSPPLWQGSPFPGLRPFTDQDAPIFFGRGRETDGLIRKLADPANRFIAVVGASGSGKSSLVWAGLIPRLRGQAAPGGDDKPRIGAIAGSQDWEWVRFTPGELGDNPFMALANSLKPTLERHGKAPRDVAAALQNNSNDLDQWVTRALAGKPEWAELLLFVDQFEELFTLVSPNYQQDFVDLLARALTLDRVRAIVTMRADFYHRCLEWPVLRKQFENEQWEKSHFPLMAPGIGQLYEMITRPAERAGLRFDEGLPQRILDDTGTEAGALALMAFALAELYEAKTEEGRLTHAAYDNFQGVEGAIGKRATDTFDKLDSGIQAKLGDVFRDLVEIDERGVATRRRTLLSKITVCAETKALVDALTDARLLVTGRGEGNESVVEVAHEALFRSWPRLKQWVQDTADDHRLRRHVAQLAAYWQEHDFKEEHRWPDDRVIEVVDMMTHLGLKPESFSELERDFLGPLDRERMLEEIADPSTPHERRAAVFARRSTVRCGTAGVRFTGHRLVQSVRG